MSFCCSCVKQNLYYSESFENEPFMSTFSGFQGLFDSHTHPLTPTPRLRTLHSAGFHLVHFSAFARTGSQVPAASQLVPAFWPITQQSQPTYQGQPQVLVCCWMLQACFFPKKTFLCPSEDLGLFQALTGTEGSLENAGFTYLNHAY